MSGADVLVAAVRRRLPGANVSVARAGNRYTLAVVSDRFARLPRPEWQRVVYAALDKVPLDLLAEVGEISCSTE